MHQGLIDIHQHLVFGVDDGPKAWEDTERMLEAAVSQGIERIIATSHVLPGRAHFDFDSYLEKVTVINEFAASKGWSVRVLPGAEIFYSSKALKKLNEQAIPTLMNSRYVLVEFLPETGYEDIFKGIRELTNGGYRVILAHVERYFCLQEKPERISELRQFGARIQMNAQTVLRSKGLWGSDKRYIRKLLKDDLVDFVATDAHNTNSRPVCLRAAYDFLEKHYGVDKANLLTWQNQINIMPDIVHNPEV